METSWEKKKQKKVSTQNNKNNKNKKNKKNKNFPGLSGSGDPQKLFLSFNVQTNF